MIDMEDRVRGVGDGRSDQHRSQQDGRYSGKGTCPTEECEAKDRRARRTAGVALPKEGTGLSDEVGGRRARLIRRIQRLDQTHSSSVRAVLHDIVISSA